MANTSAEAARFGRHAGERRRWLVSIACYAMALAVPCRGGVVLDGSLGAGGRRALTGRAVVSPTDGRRVGENLFHSFAAFDVGPGDRVTFTGPRGIANVIVRVTDPRGAEVDGTVRVTAPGASLWLDAPGGLTLAGGARFEVPGHLMLTTADEVRLGGRAIGKPGRYDARGPNAGALTSAPPSAFGFSTRRPAAIRVAGAYVAAAPGQVLGVVGGGVSVEGAGQLAALAAPSGSVQVVSVGGAGSVPMLPGGGAVDLPAVRVDRWGAVRLGDGAAQLTELADPSAPATAAVSLPRAAEAVGVRAGSLTLEDGATIAADDSGGPRPLRLGVTGRLTLYDGSAVRTSAIDRPAGDLVVRAAVVNLPGRADPSVGSGAAALTSVSSGAGPGGRIDVRAGTVRMGAGAQVLTEAHASGAGGDVTVHVRGSLAIRGGAMIAATVDGAARGGDVDVRAGQMDVSGAVAGGTFQTGVFVQSQAPQAVPGRLSVRAGALDLTAGGVIGSQPAAADAADVGLAGDVRVTAESLRIDAGRSARLTGINASTGGTHGTGAAAAVGGSVTVHANDLTLLNPGAAIIANTLSSAAAGDVTVVADHVLVDRGIDGSSGGPRLPDGRPVPTGIGAQVERGATGRGGQVVVRAGGLTVRRGGRVSVTTEGAGPAGALSIDAGEVRLESGGRVETDSRSDAPTARGGDLTIRATGTIAVLGGSQVDAQALAADAGDVTLGAGRRVLVSGAAHAPSAVTATARSASGDVVIHGGNVRIDAPLSVRLNHGFVRTDTPRGVPGDGGRITIDPLVLRIRSGGINASGGINGGDVALSADAMVGVQVRRGAARPGDNVIATGATGTAGAVNATLAHPDFLDAVTRLSASLAAPDVSLQPLCGQGARFNSFVTAGRGGLSLDPARWGPDPGP